MPKKLKKVVKSLYSYEIRKDVSLSSLRSLKLHDAWPLIREEIELELGAGQLTCLPLLTEPALYTPGSFFLQEGVSLKPLGALAATEEARGDTRLHALPAVQDPTFIYPHDSIKITLQDESSQNKVRVIMATVTQVEVPAALLPPQAQVSILPHPQLSEGCELVLVTRALCVGTLEFRVTRAACSRIFHLGQRTPLLLALCRFRLAPGGRLVPMGQLSPCAELHWLPRHPTDELCAPALHSSSYSL